MRNISYLASLCCMILLVVWPCYASADEPIVIGAASTFENFPTGAECLEAVKLAIQEINSQGGAQLGDTKRPLKLEVLDLKDWFPDTPHSEVMRSLEKFITEKKVKALLIGPARSEALLAVMEVIAKHNVPLLGSIAMSPRITQKVKEYPEKYKSVFRVCFNAKNVIGYLVQTLGILKEEFGFDRLFFVHADALWAKGATGAMTKVAPAKVGCEIAGSVVTPKGTTDFSAALVKAKISRAHVIMSFYARPDCLTLFKQWQEKEIPAVPCGVIGPLMGSAAWEKSQHSIGGILNLLELGSAIPSEKYPPAKKFYEAFRERYGKAMQAGHGPGPSYDSVYVLVDAIKRAGTLEPEKLVAALKKTDVQGAGGRIRFDDSNQVVYGHDPKETACAAIIQWTNDGRRKIVFPKDLSEGRIELPAWIKPVK